MSTTSTTVPTTAPVPVGQLVRPALAVALLLLVGLYLVTMDQGALSRSGMFLHELMHDGRHLLGVPCH